MSHNHLISVSIFIAGSPVLLLTKSSYSYKETLEVNELAFQQITSIKPQQISQQTSLILNDNYGSQVFFEPLLGKSGQTNPDYNFIILLATQQANPFIINEFYINPMQEIIKQATGLKPQSSSDQIWKSIQKNQSEIESCFSDILAGLDSSFSKSGKLGIPRLNKKPLDFYELNYQQIQNRFMQSIDSLQVKGQAESFQQLSQLSYKSTLNEIKIDKISPRKKSIVLSNPQQEEIKADLNQSVLNQSMMSQQSSRYANPLKSLKLSGVTLERLELTMDNQQISQADLLGQITLIQEYPPHFKGEVAGFVPVSLLVEDDNWHDRSKFQIMKNPTLQIEYGQQVSVQTQHIYQLELQEPQTVVLQYKMNPQLLKELPIIVMWTQDDKGRIHLKYMINKKYKNVSYLVFNIGDNSESNMQEIKVSQEEIKRLRSQQHFLKVEKDLKILKLWIANLKQHQGIIEFECGTLISTLTIELMIKDQLLSELSQVGALLHLQKDKPPQQCLLNVLKRIDPQISRCLFVSTFCSIFENDEATTQWHSLDYEGSLYIVETSDPSSHKVKSFKIILLNRKHKQDYIEQLSDTVEFKQNQKFVFYRSAEGISPESAPFRGIFFSVAEEKEQFLNTMVQVKKEIAEMKSIREKEENQIIFTRDQVKETLEKIVKDDKFVDYFYKLLVDKYGKPAEQ